VALGWLLARESIDILAPHTAVGGWVDCAREPRGRGGGQRSGFSITRSRSLAAFQTAD
jgi:hypothetical protein